jgi:hypothetical protein
VREWKIVEGVSLRGRKEGVLLEGSLGWKDAEEKNHHFPDNLGN